MMSLARQPVVQTVDRYALFLDEAFRGGVGPAPELGETQEAGRFVHQGIPAARPVFGLADCANHRYQRG